jgi:hypothetical protein
LATIKKPAMKRQLLYFIFTIFIVTFCQINQLKAQNTDYKKVYKSLTPNQFLDHLVKYTGFKFITFGTAPVNWINETDIDTLITRIYDTTAIPSIVNPLSSYLPNEKSCIGREAQNMIQAYLDKKSYLDFLYSYGSVDTLNATRLVNWYKNK